MYCIVCYWSQVKDTANRNVFTSAMVEVEDHLKDVPTTAPAINLPRPEDLVRKANRFRQNLRPDDPRAMDFEVKSDTYGPRSRKTGLNDTFFKNSFFA